MSELSAPPLDPIELLLVHNRPKSVFAVDVADDHEIFAHDALASLAPEEKADLLFTAITTAPSDAEGWEKYKFTSSPRFDIRSFAVGAVFGACAQDPKIMAAFTNRLRDRSAEFLDVCDERLLIVGLTRAWNAINGHVGDPASLTELTSVFGARLDAPTLETFLTERLQRPWNFNEVDDNRSEKAEAVIEGAADDPESRGRLEAQLGQFKERLNELSHSYLVRHIEKHGMVTTDASYRELQTLLTDIANQHPDLPPDTAQQITILTCKGNTEYLSSPLADNTELLEQAQRGIRGFFSYVIERHQANPHLPIDLRDRAKNTIITLLKSHAAIDTDDGVAECDYLKQIASQLFPTDEPELWKAFKNWENRQREEIAQRNTAAELQIKGSLPPEIHGIDIRIPEGVVRYGHPDTIAHDIAQYFRRLSTKDNYQPTPTERRQLEKAIATTTSNLRAWAASETAAEPHKIVLDFNYGIPNFYNRLVICVAKTPTCYTLYIDQRKDFDLDLALATEDFAQTTKNSVHYTETPTLEATIRPSAEELDDVAQDKAAKIVLPVQYVARLYSKLLGTPLQDENIMHGSLSQNIKTRELTLTHENISLTLPNDTHYEEGQFVVRRRFTLADDYHLNLSLPVINLAPNKHKTNNFAEVDMARKLQKVLARPDLAPAEIVDWYNYGRYGLTKYIKSF